MADIGHPSTPFDRGAAGDALLLERIAAGHAEALDMLIDRHWTALATYAARLLGSWDAAEDVAQETFVRIWERREAWSSEGSVQALLYSITRNLTLDARKRQDRRARWTRDQYRDERRVPTPSDELRGTELEVALQRAVAELPERRREVYVLAREGGLSYREIGEVMQIAPQTVANQLSAALAALRNALAPYLDSPAAEPAAARRVPSREPGG